VRETSGSDYTERLVTLGEVWWKRLLRPLDPWLASIRRRHLGRTLDVGCGVGRNLAALGPESVGVDHNSTSVEAARAKGLDAVTVEELRTRGYQPGTFDAVLVSHVIEHLDAVSGNKLLRDYLPYLRSGGRVVLLCPQERGFASDPTHVRWTTGDDLVALCKELDLRPKPWRSFPLPRRMGRLFVYNEFQVEAVKP